MWHLKSHRQCLGNPSDRYNPGRIVSDFLDVKSIFNRPTKCACTMPIVVPEEIFLLALRQLLCPTKCAFPHCSSTRPAKCAAPTLRLFHIGRIVSSDTYQRFRTGRQRVRRLAFAAPVHDLLEGDEGDRTCAGCQIRPGSHFGSSLIGLIA